MAFTFDAKTTAGVTTATGITVSHTVGATADLLTVCMGIRGNPAAPTVTYAGAAATLAASAALVGDEEKTQVWHKITPATGANNVVSALGSSIAHGLSIASWIVDSTPAALDVVATNSGSSGNPSVTVSGAVGGLGVDCCTSERPASPPFIGAGADQTILHNFGTGSWGMGASYEIGPTAAEVFNWDTSADAETWAHAVAIYKEAAGGTAHTVNVDDTVSIADAIPLTQGKVIADTVSLADALAFARELGLADTLSLADAVALGRGLGLADTVSLADDAVTLLGKQAFIDDTVSLADALAFVRGLGIDDTLSLSDALAFTRSLVFADTVGIADNASPVLTTPGGAGVVPFRTLVGVGV